MPFRFQQTDAGNRTQHIHTDNVSNATTFTLTYNDLNQLETRTWDDGTDGYKEEYSYDLNGNLTRKDESVNPDMMMGWELRTRWDYSWHHENRLIQVVHWQTYNETGMLYLRPWKRVEFYYCPACGGNRTQKVVYMNDNWSSEDTPDWSPSKWLRYETLGLDQLRVDEKYDSDQDGLDEADPFRTERTTHDAPSAIGYIMKETLYHYSTPYTASNPTKEDIWYHYDRVGMVAGLTGNTGSLVAGQSFHCDSFGIFAGGDSKTTRRIAAKEQDPDIDLYYFNARWYSGNVGRFISRDQLSYSERYGHTYVYGLGNPVCFVDVSGLVPHVEPTPTFPFQPTPTRTPTPTPTPTPPPPYHPTATPEPTPNPWPVYECSSRGGKWGTVQDVYFGGDAGKCHAACMAGHEGRTTLLTGGVTVIGVGVTVVVIEFCSGWTGTPAVYGGATTIRVAVGGFVGGTLGHWEASHECWNECADVGCYEGNPPRRKFDKDRPGWAI